MTNNYSLPPNRDPSINLLNAGIPGANVPPAPEPSGVQKVIGREDIFKARETLEKYKSGKATLEDKIIENEEWYRLRHWDVLKGKAKNKDEKPASAWLLNCLMNKHADAMDNYPTPNILPREEGDKPEAEKLSSIIPVVLDQAEFEKTYSDVWTYKLKTGTGVYGIFWDKSKHNGLGDITISKIDLLNLFWEPGITDIQRSKNIFHIELVENDLLEDLYPALRGRLGSSGIDVSRYVFDDNIDTSTKSAVIDWYYKKNVGGRTVLHYVKFVNDEVLFASENEEGYAERGFYDHGLYPFVFDVLFPVEGSPAGFGYIDVGKNAQEYIDRGNQAVLRNMLANARPRYFVNDSADVNEKEFANFDNDIVHYTGNSDIKSAIMPITAGSLNGIYVTVLNNKIEELKETTGNRDVSNGGTSSGVTAASAIAAMQEAGSKLSRDAIKSSYRAFKGVVNFIIELIRQFYDVPRQFRILGEGGTETFERYSNKGIVPQYQGRDYGVEMGYRLPVFDIEVTAQKQSPYTKMSQNELMLQFYNAGFFIPQNADAASACLEGMDFDRKSFIMKRVQQNGMMFQQIQMLQQHVMQLAQTVDELTGGRTNMAAETAAVLAGQGGGVGVPGAADPSAIDTERLDESSTTRKARERTAEATSPR